MTSLVRIPGSDRNGGSGQDVDIDTLSREQLIELKTSIEAEIDRIKIQLDEAKSRAAAEGVYADRQWFQRATAALRWKGRESQRVQAALARVNAAQKAANVKKHDSEHDAFVRSFMRVAKERLGEEQYGIWIAEARTRMESP